MSTLRDLDEMRREIDAIDHELHALITQRAQLVCEIGDLKRARGVDASEFYRPEREALILARARERNRGPLSDQHITTIFREVMSACLALEAPLNVSFLGPEGSDTHAALVAHFGRSASPLSVTTPRDVCRAVTQGRAHYGVIPVYNQSVGDICGALGAALSAAYRAELCVIGEVRLDIRHQLFARSEVSRERSDAERNITHFWVIKRARASDEIHGELSDESDNGLDDGMDADPRAERGCDHALQLPWVTLIALRDFGLSALLSLCERHGAQVSRVSPQRVDLYDPHDEVSRSRGVYLVELMGKPESAELTAMLSAFSTSEPRCALRVLGSFVRAEIRVSRG